MPALFDKLGIKFLYPDDWTLETSTVEDEEGATVFSPGGGFWSIVIRGPDEDPVDLAKVALVALGDEYEDLDIRARRRDGRRAEARRLRREFLLPRSDEHGPNSRLPPRWAHVLAAVASRRPRVRRSGERLPRDYDEFALSRVTCWRAHQPREGCQRVCNLRERRQPSLGFSRAFQGGAAPPEMAISSAKSAELLADC